MTLTIPTPPNEDRTVTETQYGQFQDDTSWYAHAGFWDAGELAYLTMGLMGEGGEFTDAVKKLVRETGFANTSTFQSILEQSHIREKLLDELGDAFWYINKLMRFLDVSLEELMLRNTYKLYMRMMSRPHSELGELKWPFDTPLEDVIERFHLLKDKEHDGVR